MRSIGAESLAPFFSGVSLLCSHTSSGCGVVSRAAAGSARVQSFLSQQYGSTCRESPSTRCVVHLREANYVR